MICGPNQVSLNAVLKAQDMLIRMANRGQGRAEAGAERLWVLFAVHSLGGHMIEFAGPSQQPEIDSIVSFFTEARFSVATDPKDKCFGLYGILQAAGVSTYRDTATAIIQATNSLKIIHNVDGLGSTPDRPSWVPDWSSSKHSIGPCAVDCFATQGSQPKFHLSANGNVLSLRGTKIDEVLIRSSLSYMHVNERIGKPQDYALWTKNPPLIDGVFAPALAKHPEDSAAILLLWDIRVLRDFVRVALDNDPAASSLQDLFDVYALLLSQRPWNEHETMTLGLHNPDIGAQFARDFFQVLCGAYREDHEQSQELDLSNSLLYATLGCLRKPGLEHLLQTQEFKVLSQIGRNKQCRRIHELIGRIRYMTVFRTMSGRIGLAPYSTEAGDEIALCYGLDLPLVVRPSGENYRLIAFAHLKGVMKGEAWSQKLQDNVYDLSFV